MVTRCMRFIIVFGNLTVLRGAVILTASKLSNTSHKNYPCSAELDGYRKNGVEDVGGLMRERDQYAEDLQSLENSFADLHRRYEKLRQNLEDYKTVSE